jgi:DNA-directed RNA polymerase specialized sigma24 family protein
MLTTSTRQKIAAAEKLSLNIYASLPWGYRVAQVLIKLSFNLSETLGRTFYALFLNSDVEGMPPGAVKGTKPERLPRGYGDRFGQRLYAYTLKHVRNPDLVENILGELLLKVAAKKIRIEPGSPLSRAESYVFQTVSALISDMGRKDKGRTDRAPKERKRFDNVDDLNLSDPNAFRNLDEMLPQYDLDQLLEELEDVNPRAPSWLEAQLNGLTGVELAEKWNVNKSRITEWENTNLPKIKNVIKQYVRDLNA